MFQDRVKNTFKIIIIKTNIYGVLIKHKFPSTLLHIFTCEVGIMIIPILKEA